MKARSSVLSLIVLVVSGAVVALGVDPVAQAAPLSQRSTVVTPEGAPTSVTARPITGGARVGWRAPVAPVGRTLVSYVVRATGGTVLAVPTPATSATFTGLAVGRWYAFTVTAVYDNASRIASTSSQRVASPVLSGWSTKTTGGRSGQVLSKAVVVRPAGTWTLRLERRHPGEATWRSVATVKTGSTGKANVKLHLVGGSWQWRLTVVGPTHIADGASTSPHSALRRVIVGSRACVWAKTGILKPPAHSGSGKRIVWDKSASQVWLVDAKNTVTCSYVVTDNDEDTPVGTYRVRSKSAMSSAVTDGRFWRLAHMVRFYLQPGHHLWIGFHAVPQAPNGDLIQPMSSLGKPGYRSHGCVRQHPTNAANLFAVTPVGGKVVVIA